MSSSATKKKRLNNQLRHDIKVQIKSHHQNKKH